MRRCLLIALVLLPSISWSQTYIGVKGGYSPLSIVQFKPVVKSSAFYGERPGFGIVFKHFNEKWFGFQGEINFNQRGYNIPLTDTTKYKRVNDYIELPILIQLRLNLAKVYFHAQAGCYVAYLLSSKEGVGATETMVLKTYQLDMLRDNRFDYGLVGGGGFSYEFSWGVIQFDVRVQYGFGDLLKHKYESNPEQSKAFVQDVSISYMYNLSKLGKKKKIDNIQ